MCQQQKVMVRVYHAAIVALVGVVFGFVVGLLTGTWMGIESTRQQAIDNRVASYRLVDKSTNEVEFVWGNWGDQGLVKK